MDAAAAKGCYTAMETPVSGGIFGFSGREAAMT